MFYNKGPFGGWFHGFGHGRFGPRFGRGDIKFVILDLLKNKPMHGYEIIQELEKKFHGFYSPSPGTVYPTLQLLEDEDFIASEQRNGKKVYNITKQGNTYLEEHKEELTDMHKRVHFPWGEHGNLFNEIREEIGQTARLIFSNAAQGKLNADKMKKIRVAFEQFRKEAEEILTKDK